MANPRARARLSFQSGQIMQAQTELGAAVKAATAALASAQARHKAILTEVQHALVDHAKAVAEKLTCEDNS